MRRLFQVVSLVVGIAALGILFAFFGAQDATEALARLSPKFLGLYLLLACLVRLGFSLRWFVVARTFGKTPDFRPFVAARLAGDATSALIPTGSVGGDPLRIGLLYGGGVGGARASAGVALDRTMELIGNTVCAVTYVSVFFYSQTAFSHSQTGESLNLAMLTLPLLLILIALAIPLVLLAFGIQPVSILLPRRLGRWPRGQRILEIIGRIENELMAFVRQRPWLLLGGILASLAIEGLVIGEYHAMLAAFGIRMDLPTLLMMLVTVGLVRVVPVPAGLGALEVGQVTLLAAAQGRADLGFLVGLIMRLHETLWMALGLVALSLQGFSLARLKTWSAQKEG